MSWVLDMKKMSLCDFIEMQGVKPEWTREEFHMHKKMIILVTENNAK